MNGRDPSRQEAPQRFPKLNNQAENVHVIVYGIRHFLRKTLKMRSEGLKLVDSGV